MIDLNTLRYFTSAFETGTFSHAARANGVSQPTVSSAIQKLEDRIGMPLFKRSKVGLKALPVATRLYHDVVDSVTHLSKLETRLLAEPLQIVRIHIAPDVLIAQLAPGLSSLRRRFANLQFSFTQDPLESDLACISDKCAPETHAFILVEEEPFRVAVSRSHPLATSRTISLEDLRNEALIQRPYCPNADHLDLALSKITFAAHAIDDHQLLDLVSAGLGLAFVPASHGRARDDIALLRLADATEGVRRIGVSHRKSAHAKQLAQLLAKGAKGALNLA